MSTSRRSLKGALVTALAVGSLTAPLVTAQAQAHPRHTSIEVVASGLVSPRDVTALWDGSVLVAEAGMGAPDCAAGESCAARTGAIYRVRGAEKGRVLTGLSSVIKMSDTPGVPPEISGPGRVEPDHAGGYLVLSGFGGDTAQRAALGPDGAQLGTLYRTSDARVLADPVDHETRLNPDGGEVFSNPWQFTRTWNGYLVTDAGANTVVRSSNGTTSTEFALPKHDLPSGESVEGVATGIVRAPGGTVYVADMSGLRTGASRIWKLTPGGTPEVVVTGLSNVVDLEIDAWGNLYALSLSTSFLPGPPEAGALYRINPHRNQVTEIPTNGRLQTPTGMDIAPNGDIYVSNKGTGVDGELLRVRP